MKNNFYLNKKLILFFSIFVISLVFLISGWWFSQRMAVAARQHALNHPEYGKDYLLRSIQKRCQKINFKINKDDQRYIVNNRLNFTVAHRYFVFDSAVLDDEECIGGVIYLLNKSNYPVYVVISKQGREVANFYFSGK